MDNQGSSLFTRMLTPLAILARWLRPSTSQEDDPRAGVPSSMEPAVQQAHEGLPAGSAAVSIEIISDVPSSSGSPPTVFEQVADTEKARRDFKFDMDTMEMKIHRYPASIRDLDKRFIDPTVVAIGPYHHHGRDVTPTETVKKVAAYHCIRNLGHSAHEISDAILSVAMHARKFYDKDLVEHIADEEFLTMMFHDACFLVQYMRSMTQPYAEMDSSLLRFFHSKDEEIFRDIMLLENQLPWMVVEAVMRFVPVDLVQFIGIYRGYLHDRKQPAQGPFVLYADYKPPHFLGLMRFYIVGRYDSPQPNKAVYTGTVSSISELAEIGITLVANKTGDLKDMELKTGILSAKLRMPPLSLDDTRPSLLINMAAHELCVTTDFLHAHHAESTVCSYLQALAMLVLRKEDVRELRTKHILEGVGFTDKEALDFFSKLHGLRLGYYYLRTINHIESYRRGRPMRTKVHVFFYKNGKTIATVFSAIGVLVGILKALQPLHKGS